MTQTESARDFRTASTAAAGDAKLKAAIAGALKPHAARQQRMHDLPDAEALRELAGRIRQHALDHLDFYLEQLAWNVQRNGGRVHFAADGEAARRIILQIARQGRCTRCIKSKSMTSEEIALRPALEEAGLDVAETDLGEFIAHIGQDRPSHIVAPILHRDRASIAALFSEYFKTPCENSAEALTRRARSHLRDKFRRADLGITGGNFVVAQSGQVCVVENEGNARYSITAPRVLVSLVGIEKVLPRPADLSVMLKLLGRSASGQVMTVYTSLFGGPRQNGEKDGPEEFHLVLLDSGRSQILGGEYRQVLRCIRCGACLNACPVYRSIGGHAYGGVYSGPIGALLMPLFQGLERFSDLPGASSLCGACAEVCPVKIDIPRHLVNLRRDIVAKQVNSPFERLIHRAWAWMMKSRWRYGAMMRVQGWVLRRRAKVTGWVESAPFPAGGWTRVRAMPPPAERTFHQLWRDRVKNKDRGIK